MTLVLRTFIDRHSNNIARNGSIQEFGGSLINKKPPKLSSFKNFVETYSSNNA